MKIENPYEIKTAIRIFAIILIVLSFILLFYSGIIISRPQKEDTLTVMGNRSLAFGINVDRDQTARIRYDVIDGLDTIRIIIQIVDINGDITNFTETNGREISFRSDGNNNYRFNFINYGNESTTIHYELFIPAHSEKFEYLYLSVVCFISSAIILVASSIKKKDINKNDKKD